MSSQAAQLLAPGVRPRLGSFHFVELDGKTVLLTGATGGLGRAIATAIAGRGATLVLSARKPEALQELADSLPGEGHRTLVSDLAREGAAERWRPMRLRSTRWSRTPPYRPAVGSSASRRRSSPRRCA
jgi:predicted amino acid dehydrogenase